MKLLLITFFAAIALVFDLNAQNSKNQSTKGIVNEEQRCPSKELYHFKIISAINNTWGYDIFRENKLFIHQTSIPCLPGNEGFNNKSDAEKVAKLVIEKLENGEMPPSVTQDEIKKLNIILTK